MGNMCTAEQKEQFEDKVEDAVDAVKEVAQDIKEKVEETVEQAKEVAEDVKEKVEDIVEDAKEKVEEMVEPAKEAAADAAEAVADKAGDAQEKAEEIAATVQESVAEGVAQVKEAAADAAEAVADTMTAAVAAVTGSMIVEFDDRKGSTKAVDFKTKDLGFTFIRSSGGCCVSAPAKAKVVVGKVDKKQQADNLGVKAGWGIMKINGTDVTGLEQATKLLEEGKAKLAEA